jgi:RNA methyltransferase, TrmH family
MSGLSMCHKVINNSYMLSKSKLKYIQSLGHKKFRDETGLFVAEGPKIILELLAGMPGHIITIYALDKWINENLKLSNAFEIVAITEKELERMSQLPSPNQAVAVIKKMAGREINTAGKITLALDTIQDPGNLGTIIRIADWFGVYQIVASEESADMYNPKVVQSTMGSLARVNIVYTNLKVWLEKQQVKIYAASLDGEDITRFDKLTEGIIVIGNEAKGISEEIMSVTNEKITIPRLGHAESLNAAVATGIILSRIAL